MKNRKKKYEMYVRVGMAITSETNLKKLKKASKSKSMIEVVNNLIDKHL